MYRGLPFGLLFACLWLTGPAAAQESLLDTVLKRDKLLVATYSTSPPLAYVDDNGKLVGFEIDMAHEIAKDLLGDPEKVEFVVVQSDGRFPAALSGKVDFGLCSTTIYPDRAVRSPSPGLILTRAAASLPARMPRSSTSRS
jgi:polar amino acid transport system substrate-binding protein